MEELTLAVKFLSQYAKDGGAYVIIGLCTIIMLYARSEYKILRDELSHMKIILSKIMAIHSQKYPDEGRLLYDDTITAKEIQDKKSK